MRGSLRASSLLALAALCLLAPASAIAQERTV